MRVKTILTFPMYNVLLNFAIKCTASYSQDMGIVVLGKIESGGVCKGSSLTLMPNRVRMLAQGNDRYWILFSPFFFSLDTCRGVDSF